MLKLLFLIVLSLGGAHSEVVSDTLCYRGLAQEGRKKEVSMVFRRYFDSELDREVGGFVQYGVGAPIAVIFSGNFSTSADVDYEQHWLEVIGGRISGEYALVKPKGATVLGMYLKYMNFRTRREAIFAPSDGVNGECEIKVKR